MNLKKDTINKLALTIQLDECDLLCLNDPAVRLGAHLRGTQHRRLADISRVRRDLANKRSALEFEKRS